ncbi:MAG: DUF937 domain-containing protein [Pseudomonadota bacterium]
MNIFDMIGSTNNGQAIGQLARQFGVSEDQANAALKNLLPAVAGGVKKNTQDASGMGALLQALERGNHDQYLDQPEALEREETVQDGNAILGHIFGDKQVSRDVAATASQRTGLDTGILKKMLPVVASLAMGAMAKQRKAAAPQSQSQGGGLADMISGLAGGQQGLQQSGLGSLLDMDGDGSVVDDVIGLAGKLFR